jgi:UDP-2,4-diacetamido-2,4,6-trideoxy-beta-L-altropyranose hydrolase
MAEFMTVADLGIGAGGTTIWERCYLELPSIVISVAENQVQLCEDCFKAGYIYYLGFATDVTENIIKTAVQQMCSTNVVKFIKNYPLGEMKNEWWNDIFKER